MPNLNTDDLGVKGRIHSIETFGTVDGPGIRFVLFMQGCALRCQYCHNPDSWDTQAGQHVEVRDVIAEIEPYINYYKMSGGGITVTGGEPSLQAGFVSALFRECKRRWGLHTALDSSGFCEPSHAGELIDATDLVLLDLKQMNPERHEQLTSRPYERIHRFARFLSDRRQPMWIRHVVIPEVTYRAEDLDQLGRFIGTLHGVEKVELLAYHRMGVYKWKQLGLDYPLEGISTPSDDQMSRARHIVETARAASAAETQQ